MSKKRRSTFGLQLGQLADLFAIAVKGRASTGVDHAEERLAEKLRNQLMEVITKNSLLLPAASDIPENKRCDVASLTGQSLQDVLLNPKVGIEQLRVVKEAGKRLTATSTSETERAVATTIYHAAIACCLVYHDKKISQHSYDKLDESFILLMEKKWMVDELVGLFSQARCICQSNRSKK